ncbi:DUF2235 domain-containing protein [Providencia stuartii]
MSNKIDPTLIDIIKEESAKYLAIRPSQAQGNPCWSPPQFPNSGRLALTKEQLTANYEKIIDKEIIHQKKAKEENNDPCCKTLHISLFFDGTNNNDKNDTKDTVKEGKPPHPSNVAKLYHACSPNNYSAIQNGFYSFYIPGVGTPFPDIGTYEYYSSGLTYATGGEARISWGLLQVCNALYHAITGNELTLAQMRSSLKKMSSNTNYHSTTIFSESPYQPMKELARLLAGLKRNINRKPKIIALKIYIYGFSRGAAEARTFVYWLDKFIKYHHDSLSNFYTKKQKSGFSYVPLGTLYGIPVSVEFLGLFDTVAAVGLANLGPGVTGHNGWAYGTQQLPKSSLVKNCCHLVAAHEQRLCFTVDSVRTPEGIYPPNTVEIIYPGMHSDIGGGYPPNDQGKARNGTPELLSQIALHDMYAAAIDAGAPLAISQKIVSLLPNLATQYSFRIMDENTEIEFEISEQLIDRFNSWLECTLPERIPRKKDQIIHAFDPQQFVSADLEYAMEIQLILITAWRIGRYASPREDSANLTHQDFFQHAPQHENISVQPYEPAFSAQAIDALAEESTKNEKVIAERAKSRNNQEKIVSDLTNWKPSDESIGPPLFDATNSRGQFWEASLEFKADFEDKEREKPLLNLSWRPTQEYCKKYEGISKAYLGNKHRECTTYPMYTLPGSGISPELTHDVQNQKNKLNKLVFLVTSQNEYQEFISLKAISLGVFKKLIGPHMYNQLNNPNIIKIIKLFDDQIHDSRAWFMHSELGIREPFASYFLSRMIYFGKKSSKSMQLIISQNNIYGYYGHLTSDEIGIGYKPLYGAILIDLSTGEEIAVDTSKRPSPTYLIQQKIWSIVEQQKKDEHHHNLQALHAIAEK